MNPIVFHCSLYTVIFILKSSFLTVEQDMELKHSSITEHRDTRCIFPSPRTELHGTGRYQATYLPLMTKTWLFFWFDSLDSVGTVCSLEQKSLTG